MSHHTSPTHAARVLALALIVAMPGIVVWVAPAGAQELDTPASPAPTDAAAPSPADIQFSVYPAGPESAGRPHFEYLMQPTQTLTDTVSVANLGTEPIDLSIYAADAFNTTDGGFSLVDRDTPSEDVGGWIMLAAEQQSIAPGTQVDIPFELTVPEDASPGDHVGGIVAQATPTGATNAEGMGVGVAQRVGARVYLTVDGPAAPALDVGSIELERDAGPLAVGSGDVTATYVVRNTGNVRLSGTAVATLSGPFGTEFGTPVTVELPELLPGGELPLEAVFDGVPAAGRLTASIDLRPGDADDASVAAGASITRSASVWAIPWAALLLLVLVVVVVVWVVRRRRRTRRSPVTAVAARRPTTVSAARGPDASPTTAPAARPAAVDAADARR